MKPVIIARHTHVIVDSLLSKLASAGIPPVYRVIFRGRNVVAVSVDGRMCVKEFKVPGIIKGFIYRYIRAPKAQRAYDNAIRLRALGINTPEPIGVVLVKSRLRLGRSYYVCRYLAGADEMRGVEKRADFPAIARAFAGFIHTLHVNGVYMKDLTMGNVLFREVKGGYSFSLVDINRMSFGVTDRDLLLSNFKALLDTHAGVERVAREYAAIAGEPDADAFVARMCDIYAAHQVKVERRKRRKKLLKKLKL